MLVRPILCDGISVNYLENLHWIDATSESKE
jgi:hypothetical protein